MNDRSQGGIGDSSDDEGPGGLTSAEARERLVQFGPNRLRQASARSTFSIFLAQFRSVVVLVLMAAGIFSAWTGDLIEAAAIAGVLIINTAIGFASELRGVQAMQSLRKLTVPTATVRRDGRPIRISSYDIVPGDCVLLVAGDIVPADLRLSRASDLHCDESALTGEAVPVPKRAAEGAAVDAGRTSIAFQGTAVTRGSGMGVATRTGMATELGRIAALAQQAQPESSPLLTRLNKLGGQLVWITAGIVSLLFVLGVMAGQDPQEVAKTAIALGVAAIPEGLPVVATLVLARGMWRMAQQNAVVRTLSAVETLGATTLILTDKTGTLTENVMTLTELWTASGRYTDDQLFNGVDFR